VAEAETGEAGGVSDRTRTRGRSDRANGAGPDGDVTEQARDRVEQALRPPGIDIGAALRAAGSLAADLLGAVAAQAQSAVPRADLDERDPDYIRESLPGMWMLASLYFRADVRGLANIPEEGPVLLAGNHSGGNLTPDTGVFTLAFTTYFGVERRFYQLAHNLVLTLPGLSFLRKYGTVAATPQNANKALDSGAALLVYPGGDYEVHRPSWETAKVDFGRRKGFIRLALEKDVPLVPVVSIGGQETALFLSRGERLAKLLGLDRMFRLKVLPISLAIPWGLNVGDMMGHWPLPAKITVEVLEPIHIRDEFGDDPDLDEVYDEIIARMQMCLNALQTERRLPVLG
jgi:1-acyl-sn-glycerol-3-phosphate acyltransferase